MIRDGTTVKVSPNEGIERLKNVEKRDFTFEQRVRANPRMERLGRWMIDEARVLGKPHGDARSAQRWRR
jgi:hypothetical protein